MKNILVADVMTRSPITIKPDTNLFEATKIMVRKKVGTLLLVNKKRLVGILAQKDILWALIKKSKADLSKIRAIDISPKKIATIKPTATIEEALKKMRQLKFESLPVIHENELIGIVTTRDIITFSPEFYPDLGEIAEIRELSKKLQRVKKAKERAFVSEGICEECGHTDVLYKTDGMLICESCRNSR